MTRSISEQWKKVHERAMKRFKMIHAGVYNERRQSMEDRRFYSIAGAQWEGPLADQFENKPKFEVNKIHLAVIRLVSEYRNNRIGVTYQPRLNDKTANSEVADIATGMYRACEEDSVADESYDNAFEEAGGGGMGAWRLRACFLNENDPEDERQTIKIEPIFDADARVFFDNQAKRADKEDAKWNFVLTSYEDEAYEEEWPGTNATSWPQETLYRGFDWTPPNQVFVAEYYEEESKKQVIETWKTIDGVEEKYTQDDFEDDESLRDRLESVGSKKSKPDRTIKIKRIHKWLMNGAEVLEDCGQIPGEYIPIVVAYGKRWMVDGIERCMGLVRLAKDPQRLKNMQLSKLGEIAALSSVSKPILTPEQIAGHTSLWRDDNIENYPYLLLNQVKDPATGQFLPAQPLAYTKPPEVPQALATLLELTEADMRDILGTRQDTDKMISNISGQAVDLIQQQKDIPTYIYSSNFKKAMKTSGKIWLSMAKEIYVEEGREVKTVNAQNELSLVKLNVPKADPKTHETNLMMNLSKADLDLTVETGPSSSTRRTATVRSLTGMMSLTQDPDTLQVLTAAAMMNMEGEGLNDIRKYFRNLLLKKGVVTPTPEEKQSMDAEAAAAPEDPNTQYLRAAAEEAIAKAMKARSDADLSTAKAAESEVNTAAVLQKIGQLDEEHLLALVKQLESIETAQQEKQQAAALAAQQTPVPTQP